MTIVKHKEIFYYVLLLDIIIWRLLHSYASNKNFSTIIAGQFIFGTHKFSVQVFPNQIISGTRKSSDKSQKIRFNSGQNNNLMFYSKLQLLTFQGENKPNNYAGLRVVEQNRGFTLVVYYTVKQGCRKRVGHPGHGPGAF